MVGPSEEATKEPGGFLVARGISKSFGSIRALQDVDFKLGTGEVVALAGENGSGKSTLVKILAGVLHADAGTVVLDGEPVRFATPRVALDAGVALVTQEPTAVPNMSIGENVMLTYLRRPGSRFRRRAIFEKARTFLELVGLDVDPAKPFVALRAGERELAEVAKALAGRPRLLILDEVTSRLRDAAHLFAIVERLRDDNVSTVFITHRLREIRRLADRAIVLRDGRRVGELSKDDLTEERLSSMMVGRSLKSFFHRDTRNFGTVAIQVKDVIVSVGKSPTCLEVRRHEIVGLAGLMGSGRTELLETIAGIRVPRSGKIAIGGKRLKGGSVREALAAGVTLVPEDRIAHGLVLGASVRENISMGTARALSIARSGLERERAQRCIERLGIRTASVETPVAELSGGNQQKVVIARSLLRRPAVLLLDEPTRGLDIGAKEEVYRIIHQLLVNGVAVIVASSELLELLGICDRIVVMHEGSVAGELSRQEATEARVVLLSGGGQVATGVG